MRRLGRHESRGVHLVSLHHVWFLAPCLSTVRCRQQDMLWENKGSLPVVIVLQFVHHGLVPCLIKVRCQQDMLWENERLFIRSQAVFVHRHTVIIPHVLNDNEGENIYRRMRWAKDLSSNNR